MILIVHVCSLWYSHSVKVNYCKTSKTDIPLQEDRNKIEQKQCGHLVQQNIKAIIHFYRMRIPEAAYMYN